MVIVDFFMSEKKSWNKTEEEMLLLNTHKVSVMHLLFCAFFAKKIIAPSLYYNQQKVSLLQFKRVNATVKVDL